MKRVEKTPGRALGSLCRAVLVLSLVLPGAFAWGEPAKNAKEEPFQDSLLGGKGFGGNIYIYQGRDIFSNGPMMPLKRFLVSYRSEGMDERDAVFSFLLGVTDVTEGKMWCSYNNYTLNTVLEAINEEFKRLKPAQHNERAAYVITEILRKKYPCKKTDSFSMNDSVQDIKDEPFQKSILVGEGLAGEQITRQGEGIFVPNLSLRHFQASYRSKDTKEKSAAYTFLLGVSDATEGKVWCSYNRFKPTTVLETIYSGWEKLDSSRYDERAAFVITEILKNDFPCKKER